MPEPITHAIRTKAVRLVARRYVRRWKWIDQADIEQEAYALALEAENSLGTDPDNPVGFLTHAIASNLVTWLWKQTKPITVTKYAVRESPRNLDSFAALVIESYVEQVDEATRTVEWKIAVQQRVRALLDEADGEALSILTGDVRPRELATDLDASIGAIYNMTRRVKRRLEADSELQRLWRQAA